MERSSDSVREYRDVLNTIEYAVVTSGLNFETVIIIPVLESPMKWLPFLDE